MNSRERFIQCGLNRVTDRGVFWEDRYWRETIERWKKEGMPDNYDFGFDFLENESVDALGIKIGYNPEFTPEMLKDEGFTKIIRDENGIVKRVKKSETGMPQFLTFPVHDRKSWEELKPRLDPESDGRFPEDWDERVRFANSQDKFPVSFGGKHLCGFFSLLRELCGDGCYYLFYDDPELVRDIVEFQEYRLTTFIKKATRDAKIDRQFIWEDMCFNKGPLISPQLFRDFLLEPYQRTIETAKKCGVHIIDLDSDGRINELIPLWLEAGVDMLHPFEVAAGMDVNTVKKQYGKKLSMRGGVDKREISKDFAAIDKEIERIRPAFEMGGYIPHFDHSVPPTVSWDNYRYYLEKLCKLLGK